MAEKFKKYLIVFKLYDGTTRSVPIEIPVGEDGAPGGYYKPEIYRVSDTEIMLSFTPSDPDMPSVEPVNLSSLSPDITLEETESGFVLSVTDESGTEEVEIYNGYSTYYLDQTVDFPSGEDSLTAQFSYLSNNGERVKAGDVLISRNGTLCIVREVGGNFVRHEPVSSFYGTVKGDPGYSIYSSSTSIQYPAEGFASYMIAKTQLSNRGAGIKVGDLVITKNGTLCEVTSVASSNVSVEPFASMAGAQGKDGNDGYSVFYAPVEVEYPVEGLASHMIAKTQLSNGGYGIKVGDLIITANGTLCKVTEVSSSQVSYEPVTNFAGEKGSDGAAGADGADGYSIYSANTEVTYPSSGIGTTLIAKTQLSNGGAGIKVGDLLIAKNGTLCQVTTVNSANVAIEPISSIAGKDGADGYTPVRGTDYWTDADKAEIKAYVDEAILGGEW